MAEVDAVEGADRDRSRTLLELRRRVRDPHAAARPGRRQRRKRRCRADLGLEREHLRPQSVGHAVERLGRQPPERIRDRHEPARVGLLDPERPDGGPPQRRAVASERLGDRADIRAGRHVEPEPDLVARIRDDVERVDLRTAQGHLHLDALPREPVGALTADLHRRGGGDRQLDLTAEALEPSLELRPSRSLVPLARLAFGIAGRGRRGEIDVRDVPLVQTDKARSQSSCRTGQQDQQPARERVERPGMARCELVSGGEAPRRARTTTARRACRRERFRPGWLLAGPRQLRDSTAARNSRRMNVDDLLDRVLARESGRLHVTAAARLARDRRDVERRRCSSGARCGASARPAVGGSRISATSSEPSAWRRKSMIPSENGSSAPTSAKSVRSRYDTTTRPSS